MNTFTFTFNIDQLNVILGALAELPFRVSHTVITEINQQITAQQNIEPAAEVKSKK